MFVCLALPGKVIEIDNNKEHAFIDYGEGTKRKANISLVDVTVGDYVLVHAGFAIEVLDKKEVKETIAIFREMLSFEEEK
jgi:hydrogenase expression/formation protein HypC